MTQVVVCGVSTPVGVEMTVREAYELGYHVTVPLDACTDTATDHHVFAAEQVLPRYAETGTTAAVLSVLTSRS